MKPLKLTLLSIVTACLSSMADTNQLELHWAQPPGYGSTLYSATNLSGTWTELSTNSPPLLTQSSNGVAFFLVIVKPQTQLAGSGAPAIDAPAGCSYIDTNSTDLWFNVTGGTNGWQEYISGN